MVNLFQRKIERNKNKQNEKNVRKQTTMKQIVLTFIEI